MATRKERDDQDKGQKSEPEEKPEKLSASDSEEIEVEIGGDEDEEEEVEAVPEEPKLSRAEKKRQRGQQYSQMQERLAQLEREREQERLQYQQWQESQRQHQQQQQMTAEEQALYAEQKRTYKAFEALRDSGRLTDADVKEYESWVQDFERRKTIALMRSAGVGPQADPRQIAQMAEYNRIRAQYSDIYGNPQALQWGDGELRKRVALNGGQLTYEIIDEVAQETRQRFGMTNGNRRHGPPPDAATRQRFSGIPARSSRTGGSEPVTVRVGRAQRQLARSLYPDLDEAAAVKKWANGPGRRALIASQKER